MVNPWGVTNGNKIDFAQHHTKHRKTLQNSIDLVRFIKHIGNNNQTKKCCIE